MCVIERLNLQKLFCNLWLCSYFKLYYIYNKLLFYIRTSSKLWSQYKFSQREWILYNQMLWRMELLKFLASLDSQVEEGETMEDVIQVEWALSKLNRPIYSFLNFFSSLSLHFLILFSQFCFSLINLRFRTCFSTITSHNKYQYHEMSI